MSYLFPGFGDVSYMLSCIRSLRAFDAVSRQFRDEADRSLEQLNGAL